MFGDLVGYAVIKKDATTGVSPVPISNFTTPHGVRVLEFATDGGVLVVDAEGSGLCMFDKCDVITSFKCSVENDVIIPPDITDFMQKMLYVTKVNMRKGGYSNILKRMVIAASLHKGEFNDSFLWAKEKEEQQRREQNA